MADDPSLRAASADPMKAAEAALRAELEAALARVAREFEAAVEAADDLTAASFGVSGIRDMWARRVPGVITRLRRIFRRAAESLARDLGTRLPSTWDDDTASHWGRVRRLLDQVGNRLARVAVRNLQAGRREGDDREALRARLLAAFATDGGQLGTARADRLAATEATRAWNAGLLAAARSLDRPNQRLVKQWLTRHDDRVREAHFEVDGEYRDLDEAFEVGGFRMQYPGDPEAPADLTINCRCELRVTVRTAVTASLGSATNIDRKAAQWTKT